MRFESAEHREQVKPFVEANEQNPRPPRTGAFDDVRGLAIGELSEEFGMRFRVLDARVTNNLQARPVLIVHQKKRDAIVHGEVPGGEELAIAFVIGEGELRWIHGAQNSARAAAVLDIRSAVLAHGR
jgi:hypothetical protein